MDLEHHDQHGPHDLTPSGGTPGGVAGQASGAVSTGGMGAGPLVRLMKGSHRWTFSAEAGSEPELLSAVRDLVARADSGFDRFDGALVAHQIARRLQSGLNRHVPNADETTRTNPVPGPPGQFPGHPGAVA